MITPAELEARLRKILNEEFPSIAKFVRFDSYEEWPPVVYYCMVYDSGYIYCDEGFDGSDVERFKETMFGFAERIGRLLANGEQICRECSHNVVKYPYLSTHISFRDFTHLNLPWSMRCRHNICEYLNLYERIEQSYRLEHLCRELRILPLPIAEEIMAYFMC